MSNKIDTNTVWQDMPEGATIYEAGNSREFKTGDWRNIKPIYIQENCKQCGLCFPVCPDDSIPVSKEQKRGDFDYNMCKGCGVCAEVCPFGAIVMENE